MKNILLCRRTFIAITSIAALLLMALYKDMDTTWAIASIAMGLSGANAMEAAVKARTPAKI